MGVVTTIGSTLADSVASVASAVLLLVYWEVRAHAARRRQEALEAEVQQIAPRVVEAVAPAHEQTAERETP